MREKPPDLVVEDANELPALRHRDTEQLLDSEDVGVLLVHRRDIVEPIEVGNGLQVGLVLDELLGAAMKEPDVRIDPLDDLAVKLKHKAQHAVRRRVLRAEIDGEISDIMLGHGAPHAFAFSSPGST